MARARGALLHDLGKLGVADEILKKPDALLTSEWAAVKDVIPADRGPMIEPLGPLRGGAGRGASPRAPGWDRLPRWARRRGDPASRAHSRGCGRLRRDASGQALPAEELARGGAPGTLGWSGTPVRRAGGRGARASGWGYEWARLPLEGGAAFFFFFFTQKKKKKKKKKKKNSQPSH